MTMNACGDNFDFANQQQCEHLRPLAQGRDEVSKQDVHLIQLTLSEEITREPGDSAGLAEQRGILVSKLSGELALGSGDELRTFPAGRYESGRSFVELRCFAHQ